MQLIYHGLIQTLLVVGGSTDLTSGQAMARLQTLIPDLEARAAAMDREDNEILF